MPYSMIDPINVPDKAYACTKTTYEVVGRLTQDVNWPNFALALFYEEGPTDTIDVYMNDMNGNKYTVEKGTGVSVHTDCTKAGCEIRQKFDVHFPTTGTYKITFATGYMEDHTFYIDFELSPTVEVTEAPPPVKPRVPTEVIASTTTFLLGTGLALMFLPRQYRLGSLAIGSVAGLATYFFAKPLTK